MFAWIGLIVAFLVFGVIAIAFLVAGIVALNRAPTETAHISGTVTTAGGCDGKGAHPSTATFAVDGYTYTANGPCNAHKGQSVPVKYDPSDPGHNNDTGHSAGTLFIYAGVGAAGLLLIIPSIRQLRRTPTLPSAPHKTPETRSGTGGHGVRHKPQHRA